MHVFLEMSNSNKSFASRYVSSSEHIISMFSHIETSPRQQNEKGKQNGEKQIPRTKVRFPAREVANNIIHLVLLFGTLDLSFLKL